MNGSRVDFHHLHAMVTVADERSFTRAAQRLFVSQPALSQLVRRIEAEIGVQIFDRSAQPVGLTREGGIFVARARRLLDDYSQTLVELRKTANREQVTVGTTPLLGNILIPDLVGKAHQLDLPFTLRPVESSSQELVDLLERGVIDFAVISQRGGAPSLRYEPVAWSGFRVAIPPDTDLVASPQPLSTDEVLQQPLLLPKAGGIRTWLDGFFNTIGIAPRIAYESGSTDTMLGLVEAGIGVALVLDVFITDDLRRRHRGATFARLDIAPPPVAIGIASRLSGGRSESVARAMEVAKLSLRQLFTQTDQDRGA